VAYIVVENFNAGMDRRRKRVAGLPGSLWNGKNVHITRGGDIERRKKFVSTYSVPGTLGAAAIRGQLYVFGSANLASSMPNGVQYQRLQAPGTPAMVKLLDVRAFSGSFYAIAEYDDGHVYHFYNGTRVSDWDVIAASMASFTTVAEALAEKIESNDAVSVLPFGSALTITAKEAGTAFTISKSTTDGGANNDQDITLTTVQANVAAVAEVRATATVEVTGGSADAGVNTISSVLINNATELLGAPVDWTGSDGTTAIQLATEINNGNATHGYSAEAIDKIVTISAGIGTGATPNGYEVVATTTGNVTVDAEAAMAGGVTEVEPVAQITRAALSGTFQAADTFTITIDGTAYKVTGLASGTGRSLYVDKKRVFSPVGSLWRYCMLSRADIWDPANATSDNDSGFVNVASETEGNEKLVVAARYQGQAAIFSGAEVVLFNLDVDPANFAFAEALEKTGTEASKSAIGYGNTDVFYLDITGIRSLKARDQTNAPFVSDVGNAIDTFVQEYVDTLPVQRYRAALGAIEPRDGRLLMAIGDRIFVLSYFPGAKISAWTYYEPEEFDGDDIQAMIRIGKKLYVRAGDAIFTYGGADGETYPDDDEIEALAELPFLAGKTAGTIKGLLGYDLAATNTWAVEVAVDPNDDDRTINIGSLNRITFADPNSIPMPGQTSMVAPILRCNKAGPATISMMALHYEAEKAA